MLVPILVLTCKAYLMLVTNNAGVFSWDRLIKFRLVVTQFCFIDQNVCKVMCKYLAYTVFWCKIMQKKKKKPLVLHLGFTNPVNGRVN